MPNEIIEIHPEYNQYPEIIVFDKNNPTIRSPYSPVDLFFYQTRETLVNPDDFRSFIKSAEAMFRASREYKAYKSFLIENIGINKCEILGNITVDDADIELHHSIIGLFDICIMIAIHTINTVGKITTYDLVQLVIQEHYANRIPIVFLSKTVHQLITADPYYYIAPEQTFGQWWELLNRYKYGITYDIAYKVINYLKKYQEHTPNSVTVEQQEEILNFAWMNTYGMNKAECGEIPSMATEINNDGGTTNYGISFY